MKPYTKQDIDEIHNQLIVHLAPKDTEYLIPTTYYWSVKIGTKNLDEEILDYVNYGFSEVNTLISRKKFIILE